MQHLALTPPFDFKNKELKPITKCRYAFSIFMLLISITLVLYSYILMNQSLNMFVHMNHIKRVLFFLADIFTIGSTVISITLALKKPDHWTKLLNGCVFFNKNYKRDGHIDTLKFIFFSGNLLYVLKMVFEAIVAITKSETIMFISFIIISFHYFMSFYTTVMMFICLCSFYNGYNYVNTLIKQLRKDQKTIYNESNRMRYIYLMYTIVNERVANYNEIFGLQVFCMFAYAPTLLLSGLVSLTISTNEDINKVLLTCYIGILAMVTHCCSVPLRKQFINKTVFLVEFNSDFICMPAGGKNR